MAEAIVQVAALGASTPLGRDAWSSAAAVRAGIAAFADHPYMIDDGGGKPMKVAMAPWLDCNLSGVPRFMALLEPTIDEVSRVLDLGDATHLNVALALGVPTTRPGLPDELGRSLLSALRPPRGWNSWKTAIFAADHAAGLLALEAAWRKLSDQSLDACIVAGVDSYLEPETLEWLEAENQLHGAALQSNPWGLTPGEGAGALLVVRDDVLRQLGVRPLSRVVSVSRGFEPKHMRSQQIGIGEGLTQVMSDVLDVLPAPSQATDVYCDMNPQPYRADEFGFAAVRTGGRLRDAADLTTPADCWGDVGAASGPLLALLATCAALKGYAQGPHALLWTSSPNGERAACLLQSAYME
ncbi:beta-ketoacyl synthase N-terminal-like domain-containing protein [Paraburkholderia flagellata]|uniref:beta-ketoacyl synthase N-terminal-like domain-containing protein n=1 Tax=Paraburkholderia flagellata TaxID=2883241 RepID=UPI001F1821BF|nr:beta-ketoacyl synthase N-terminal-like domain-containing protein [Paraburkholderia flagellata]